MKKSQPIDDVEDLTVDLSFMRVLLIEDDPDTQANLADILELDGYGVDAAGSAGEALKPRDWDSYGVILLDRRLPDGTAEDLLPQLREKAPKAAVMIVTGFGDLQGAVAALRQGAVDYILKPINADALRASLARVAQEQRLKKAKERSEAAFRTLVEAAPCLIVILRDDHSIAYLSPWAEKLTGFRTAAVLGKSYPDVFYSPGNKETLEKELRGVWLGGPFRGLDCQVRCQDGTQLSLLCNARFLEDYEGKPAILVVAQDITGLKNAQERALQAERLAAIGQMVTGLAHESGNALARSRACLEMLAMELEDRPEALDLIQRIQKAQDQLQHLYEEVRSYAAPIKLDRDIWNLGGVWRQAWKNLLLLHKDRQANLEEHTDGIDLHCQIDPFRLEQVFRNILENSLAACSDPVHIDITCSEVKLEGNPAVGISIRDNGPGLNNEQKQRIFEPFFTTKTKGTGLGMAIARRIVEAHGGRLTVGSPEGPGAEILLTLPSNGP